MKGNLKKRFVIASTFVSFIVLGMIIFFINFSNYRTFLRSGSAYLEEIAGQFSQLDMQEMDFALKKYEDIYIMEYGHPMHMHQGGSCRSHKQLYRMANTILADGKKQGTYQGFRFLIDGEAERIFLVDAKRDFAYFYSTLVNSIIILLLSMVVVGVLSYLLSPYVIDPILKSQKKQKQFITDASHELKTPLSVILSNAELLEYDIPDNSHLQNIHVASQRLNGLIKDLLTLTRLDEKTSKEYKKIHVSLVVREIIEYYEDVLTQKGCTLHVHMDKDIKIQANEEDCIQLVSILLDNMTKYTQDNRDVYFNLYKKSKMMVMETVNPAEHLEKREYSEIFDRFTRLDSWNSKKVPGNGVGLAIVASIVENYKGKTSATSDGINIKITVEIPLL